ncbi:MAG: hypothetical protein ACRDFR_08095 [Candidatus Limnocylindria bacterium]
MRARSWRAWLLLAVVLALLTACASPAGVDPGSPEPVTSPSPAAGPAAQCADIDLRGTSGERVRLTGTWTAYSGTRLYYVSQLGSCVWLAGGFETSATPERMSYDGLGEYTIVFSGTLAPDFTVSGWWSAVRDCGCPNLPTGAGSITMQIDIDADPLVLEQIAATGTHQGALDQLTKISDSAIPPP